MGPYASIGGLPPRNLPLSRATRFIEGSLWMIAMRWSVRAAGLVSTVILARILTPDDFGVVAMSSLILGLLTVLSDMGTWQLLIRSGETDRRAYDTAWTIMLLQAAVLAALMFAASYPAAAFFGDPRLTPVIQLVALGSVITGFQNVGIIMFRRDLNFRRDFLFGFYSKVVIVIPTVLLALAFRSYWALVAGNIIGHALEVIVSYRMHPFRPRLSLHGWRRFVGYSLWITPSSVASYLNKKADVFIVGHSANTAQMGAYNVASELSQMATSEIVTPMSRALFPNYAKLSDDRPALATAFRHVLRTVSIICFGFGFGIAATADDVVHIVLGDQWGFAVPLVRWLGIFAAFASLLSTLTGHILVVMHLERSMLFLNWFRLAVFAGAAAWASQHTGVVGIAMAAALATGAMVLPAAMYTMHKLGAPVLSTLADIVKYLVAGCIMYAAIRAAHADGLPFRALSIAWDVAVGTVVMSSLVYAFWVASGRPDGPERRILDRLAAIGRRPA